MPEFVKIGDTVINSSQILFLRCKSPTEVTVLFLDGTTVCLENLDITEILLAFSQLTKRSDLYIKSSEGGKVEWSDQNKQDCKLG